MPEFNLHVGMKGEYKLAVTKDECALQEYYRDDLWILSGQALVRAMEIACINAVHPHMPEPFKTVGRRINIDHFRPTPLGDDVIASAELVDIDDKKLFFAVEANNSKTIMGKGTHSRQIVDLDEFISNLDK